MNDQERAELAALVCDECWGAGITTYVCLKCDGSGAPPPQSETSTHDSAETITWTFDVSEVKP